MAYSAHIVWRSKTSAPHCCSNTNVCRILALHRHLHCRHTSLGPAAAAPGPSAAPKPPPRPATSTSSAANTAPTTPASMADAAAAAAAAAVRPAWTDLQPARDLLPGLPARALLHAGPPLPRCCSPTWSEASPTAAAASRVKVHPPAGAGAAAVGKRSSPDGGADSGGTDGEHGGGGTGYMAPPPPLLIPAPLLHSAVVAVLFEGWAEGEAAARRLVLEGGVELRAAQDFRVVTPLACVVSPSMQLQVVQDMADGVQAPSPAAPSSSSAAARAAVVSYSPLQAGPPPAPRIGTLYDLYDHVGKLRRLHGPLAAALRRALHAGGAVDLLPLAAASLAAGEECHAVTLAASAALRQRLLPYLIAAAPRPARDAGAAAAAAAAACAPPGVAAERGAAAGSDGEASADGAAEEAATFLSSATSFFLNLWMAACKCALVAAEATAAAAAPGGTLVTALGGNGLTVGLQISGVSGVWFTAPAAPPTPYVPAPPVGGAPPPPPQTVSPPVPAPCGAIGDSMVVDALGFGAQLLFVLPDQDPAQNADLHRQVRAVHEARRRLTAAAGALTLALVPHPGLLDLPPGCFASPAEAPGSGLDESCVSTGTAQQIRVGVSARELLLMLRRHGPSSDADRMEEVEATEDEEAEVETYGQVAVGKRKQEAAGRGTLPAAPATTAGLTGQTAITATAGAPQRQPSSMPPSPLAVNLSVLDAAGQRGIVGRGVYFVPVALLEQAVRAEGRVSA